MTRWSLIDLTGRLIDYQIKNPDSDRWEIIELPAILGDTPETEKSLWPEQWPLEELRAKRAAMDPRFWQAQYMQNPVSDIAAMIPRTAWRVWEPEKPPKCEYILQSWDTAHETHNAADFSACTTWGVWYNEAEGNAANLILLDAFKARMGFPELKAVALKHYKEWQPDSVIIEKKGAGTPLVQELRSTGLPIGEYTPSRGNDKISRLNSIADIFVSGRVWAPGTRWAREVIEEVAAFPVGEHDDFTDCTSMALMRFRQGGYIPLEKDEKEDEWVYRARRRAAYY
jgi:predicted phage terminase large subunit-like protein